MLTFNLKKEWFDKIKSGEKTHEYRKVKAYWITRIKNHFDYLWCDIDCLKNGDVYYPIATNVILRCGYNGEQLKANVISIKIVDGQTTDYVKIDPNVNNVFDIEFKLIKE